MADANQILNDAEGKMKKAIESTKRDFSAVRTGRASANLLDNVKVEYYNTMTPISQVANISVPDNRTLEIKPWDPAILQEIEKAIFKSEIGITPTNDGKLIRLSMPPLTEERRKDFVKMVKKHAEEGKVAIRNIRQDANKSLDQLKKDIGEDEFKKLHERIQKMTDANSAEIVKMSEHKEKEIMEF